MKPVRLALLLAVLWTAPSVLAASYSFDNSDLWWADPPASENGWGIEFVQRGSVIFATMFVYQPSGAPTWYVATMGPTAPGSAVWSGDLFTTSGPWFGTMPYNPSLFAFRSVGTMTWAPTALNTGTLTYSVDGVVVTKTLTRQTLVNESYAGRFGGLTHITTTGCADPSLDGTSESFGIENISQNGTAVTVVMPGLSGVSCTFNGTLTQYGQMGDVAGSYTCADGSAGTFDISEFQVTEFSVTGRFTMSASAPQQCRASGWFGGTTATMF